MQFRWQSYPFLRIIFFLVLGIICYRKQIEIPCIEWVFGSLVSVFGLLTLLSNTSFLRKQNHVIGGVFLISIFCLGQLLSSQQDIKKQPEHFFNFQHPISHYEAVICSKNKLSSSKKNIQTDVDIQKIHTKGSWKDVTGKVKVY